jgi:hypothetical protein
MCRLRFPPSSSSIHESDPAAFVFVGVMMMMMMTTTTTTESFCLVYYFSCSFHTHTHTHTHTLKEEKKIISRAHQSFFTLWNLRQHSASSVATAAANSSRNMLFFFCLKGWEAIWLLYGMYVNGPYITPLCTYIEKTFDRSEKGIQEIIITRSPP